MKGFLNPRVRMLTCLIALASALLLPRAASAQLAITGTVLDTTDAPISGVLVELIGFASSTLADGDGNFSLSVPDTGMYQVKFSKTGFVPTSSIAQVGPDPGFDHSSLLVRMIETAPPMDIGPAGGMITAPSGETLDIPAGALDTTVPISFTPIRADATHDIAEKTNFDQYTLRATSFHFEPAGLTFNMPVTVTVPLPEEGIYDFDGRDPSTPNHLIARFVDSSNLEFTSDSVLVTVDPVNLIGSFPVDHFSDVIVYDDFGLFNWWKHWVEISRPMSTVLAEHSANCNCQQDVCKAPDVTFAFTEEKGFSVTLGAEADFGLSSEVSVAKLATLRKNYGIKFSAELTTSWSSQLGTTISFEGATYSPPPKRDGPATTRIVGKQITYKFYEQFIRGATATLIKEFTITYDIGVEHVPPPAAETQQPICELIARSPVEIQVLMQDIQSGLASIKVVARKNCTVLVPNVVFGTQEGVVATATKVDPTKGASVTFEVMDVCMNVTTCDPVLISLVGEVPESFSLEQNYPNPFNPTTTISFSLTEGAVVTLAVFDVLGREVITLVDEEMAPGTYEFSWDGTNEAGVPSSSGVYLYRLEAGTFTQTRVMTLL